MKSRHRIARGITYLLMLSAVLLVGCTKEISVWRVPSFWEPGQIEAVAVVPFRCTAIDDPEAGNTIADRLASALAANGTYDRVYNRRDLASLMTEKDLESLSGGQGDVSEILKRHTDVQAIITGTVTHFEATSQSEQRQTPQYTYDAYGNQYLAGYQVFTFTRNDAVVSVTATMLTAKTGATIHTTGVPAQEHMWAQGAPPEYSMDACLAVAVDSVIFQLLQEFAITGTTLKIKTNEAFRITTGEYFDGEWEDQNVFTTADTEMTVVISLPPEADRNIFGIGVARDGTRQNLIKEDFIWDADAPAEGMTVVFDPSEIAAAGGGPGVYVLKFYTGDEPVIENKFSIIRP